jgi:exodeoxyribonuclease VII small subunit
MKPEVVEQDTNLEETCSLEELFGELDEILSGMEERDVSLEDAFSLYEKGMKKIRQCNEKLDLVEKKMLVIANDGTTVPFE